mgnify:CR=1 FL=1
MTIEISKIVFTGDTPIEVETLNMITKDISIINGIETGNGCDTIGSVLVLTPMLLFTMQQTEIRLDQLEQLGGNFNFGNRYYQILDPKEEHVQAKFAKMFYSDYRLKYQVQPSS